MNHSAAANSNSLENDSQPHKKLQRPKPLNVAAIFKLTGYLLFVQENRNGRCIDLFNTRFVQ
jgi:hypothetical protein